MDLARELERTGYHPRPAELAGLRAMLATPGQGIRAALLEGEPGAGKTALAQALAGVLGARHLYALLHSWSDDQELFAGIDVAAAVEGAADRVRQPGILALAAESSHQGQVILVLDEIDKVQERTENLLLDFLQTGRVPVRPGLHVEAATANLLVFLTSNATRPLSDALLRRVRRIRMTRLPVEVMDRLIQERSGAPAGVATLLRKAAQRINPAVSLQELAALAGDVWRTAESVHDARELLSQWAARDDAQAQSCRQIDLAAVWGQVMVERRQGRRVS